MLNLSLIVLFNLALYWQTLKFGLIVDDLRHSDMIRKWGFKDRSIWSALKLRAYGVGTLATQEGKIDPIHEHALTIGINVLIAVLIYCVFGHNNVSFWAAILYSCNPSNNQTSIWLNGRRYALNIVIVLTMMLIGPAGLVLYPLTAFLQSSAVFSPIVFGWVPLLIAPVFWLIAGKEIREKIDSRLKIMFDTNQKTLNAKKIIPIVKIYGAYCLKMVYPRQPLIIYPFLHFWGMTEEGNKDAYAINKDFLLGVLAVGLSVLGLFYFKQKMFFWFLFMVLSTLQWSGIISVTQTFADRYISLPNVFMMFFVSYLAHQTPYAVLIVSVLAAYYTVTLQSTMKMYKNLDSCWEYHFYYDPKGVKFRENKATTRILAQDAMDAWITVKTGLILTPTDFKLNLLAANITNLFDDKKSVIYYLKVARANMYIGAEDIFKDACRGIFGVDIYVEAEKIANKQSNLPRVQRENVQKILEAVNV